jgi:DNA-binding NarL/FixJ family response regulator
MITDDHTMFREAITYFLNAQEGIQVVKEATNGQETISLVAEMRPDILLLDLMMPDMDGLEILRQVRERSPEVKVIVLTGYFDEEVVLRALQEGAIGYFLKGGSTADLVKGVRTVHAGWAWVERNVMGKFLEGLPRSRHDQTEKGKRGGPGSLLTRREEQVARLVGLGHSNKKIAERLCISEKTVKTHLTSIFKKVNASHRSQLALHTLHRGFMLREPLRED